MSAIFPFDLPGPTRMYLCVYMLTLAVHLVFMSYVLAGSAHLAVYGLLRRSPDSPVIALLRDWLPFALGATVTTGIAPLLFLQVLYRESFYTANLLLFHRWIAMVPLLIAGFYLLYLARSRAVDRWGPRAGAAVVVGALLCLGFTAYSWAENHVLALDQSEWMTFYVSDTWFHGNREIAIRTALWFVAGMPVMATIVGWQLGQKRYYHGVFVRTLATIAMLGCTMTAVLGVIYATTAEDMVRVSLGSRSATFYTVLVGLGLAAQCLAWWRQWCRKRLMSWAMHMASVGALLTLLGLIAIRELRRLSVLDVEGLAAMHRRAQESGGQALFFVMLLVNAGVIGWCLAITYRGLRTRKR